MKHSYAGTGDRNLLAWQWMEFLIPAFKTIAKGLVYENNLCMCIRAVPCVSGLAARVWDIFLRPAHLNFAYTLNTYTKPHPLVPWRSITGTLTSQMYSTACLLFKITHNYILDMFSCEIHLLGALHGSGLLIILYLIVQRMNWSAKMIKWEALIIQCIVTSQWPRMIWNTQKTFTNPWTRQI